MILPMYEFLPLVLVVIGGLLVPPAPAVPAIALGCPRPFASSSSLYFSSAGSLPMT